MSTGTTIQERVIIRSRTIIPLLPDEYDSLIDKKGENYAIYRADRYLPGYEMDMQYGAHPLPVQSPS